VCVTRCGRICIGKRKINLSQVFSGQLVGIREVDEKIWLVSFLDFDLGLLRRSGRTGRTRPQPLHRKNVDDVPGIACKGCAGTDPRKSGVPTGIRTPVLTVKGWCPRPLDDGDAGRKSSLKSIHRESISGGARRDRTADLLHAMQALSQLSYGPTWRRGTLPDKQRLVKKMNGLHAPL
jgi:hypothetical protein